MPRPVRFRKGERVSSLRPKLNQLSRQVREVVQVAAPEQNPTPSGGVFVCSIPTYGTATGTASLYHPTSGATEATGDVTRLTTTNISIPGEAIRAAMNGAETIVLQVPWPDLSAT